MTKRDEHLMMVTAIYQHPNGDFYVSCDCGFLGAKPVPWATYDGARMALMLHLDSIYHETPAQANTRTLLGQ